MDLGAIEIDQRIPEQAAHLRLLTSVSVRNGLIRTGLVVRDNHVDIASSSRAVGDNGEIWQDSKVRGKRFKFWAHHGCYRVRTTYRHSKKVVDSDCMVRI